MITFSNETWNIGNYHNTTDGMHGIQGIALPAFQSPFVAIQLILLFFEIFE